MKNFYNKNYKILKYTVKEDTKMEESSMFIDWKNKYQSVHTTQSNLQGQCSSN